MRVIKNNELFSFILITYLISWLLWLPLFFMEESNILLIVVGGFGPLIAAFIMTLITDNNIKKWLGKIFNFKIKFKLYVFVLLYPLIFYGLISILLYITGNTFTPAKEISLFSYIMNLIAMLILGGGQEEVGWRGYALPKMIKKYKPLTASFILGLIWIGWHLPLFFIKDSAQAGLPFIWYIINTLAFSIILTWLYIKSNYSVIPAMILHAGMNMAVNYFPIVLEKTYMYVAFVEIIIAVILVVYDKKLAYFKKNYYIK